MGMDIGSPQKFDIDKAVSIGSGKGKRRIYTTKLFQAFLKKYGKKWNAKVYDDIYQIGYG